MSLIESMRAVPKATGFYLPPKSLFLWGSTLGLLMMFFGFYIVDGIVSERANNRVTHVQETLSVKSSGKSEVFSTWLKGVESVGYHVARSDLVKIYTSELGVVKDISKAPEHLTAQQPYLKQAVVDFVRQNDLVGAYLIAPDGRVLIGSDNKKMSEDVVSAISWVRDFASPVVMPFEVVSNRLIARFIQPVFSMDELSKKPDVVSFLVFSKDVTGDVLGLLYQDSDIYEEGERLHLLQFTQNKFQHVDVDPSDVAIVDVDPRPVTSLEPYASMPSVVDEKDVFSSVVPVKDSPFRVLSEYEVYEAMVPVRQYMLAAYGYAAMVIALIATASSVLITHLVNTRNKYRVSIQQQALNALVRAVEIRDPYLKGHHERMAKLALKIGRQMRLNNSERATLYYSAMLSGVGKIFIPQELLNKPGKLTKKERDELEKHVDHAMHVLSDMEFDFPVAHVIHQMYERMDGSGYPNKIEGADINLLSRILSVCDVYSALTKPRSYREEMTDSKALATLEKDVDKFDKGVVGVLSGLVDVEKNHASEGKKS